MQCYINLSDQNCTLHELVQLYKGESSPTWILDGGEWVWHGAFDRYNYRLLKLSFPWLLRYKFKGYRCK